MDEFQIDENELRELLLEKARGVFKICDSEHKGLIYKNDLHKLQNILPLNSQQLDDVFERLDIEGDGVLTQQKFITGFANFLGLNTMTSDDYADDGVFQDDDLEDHLDNEEMNDHFEEMMGSMGAKGLLEDEKVIKSLWIRLHQSEPDVVRNFEEFLIRVTDNLKRTHMDYKELQMSMQNKKIAHDEELQLLYSEMEEQIEKEKERILAEEKAKERKLREQLEKELKEKDRLLSDLIKQHTEMEMKLTETKEFKTRRSIEYSRLRRERDEMGQKLDLSNQDLDAIKNKMAFLQSQKRNSRGHLNDQIAEWITRERESLLEQLQTLKETNRKLLDKKEKSTDCDSALIPLLCVHG